MINANPLHSINLHASAAEIAGQIREALQARKLREECGVHPADSLASMRAARESLRAIRLDRAEVLA